MKIVRILVLFVLAVASKVAVAQTLHEVASCHYKDGAQTISFNVFGEKGALWRDAFVLKQSKQESGAIIRNLLAGAKIRIHWGGSIVTTFTDDEGHNVSIVRQNVEELPDALYIDYKVQEGLSCDDVDVRPKVAAGCSPWSDPDCLCKPFKCEWSVR